MTRILPQQISSDNVLSLLRELAAAKPYTDDDWETASLDFDTLDICVNIRLQDREFRDRERKRIEAVIKILPVLQSTVIAKMTRPENDRPNDDHGLAWIDIDVDDGEVDLCYNGISYNTQWSQTFHVNPDGTWTQ